MFQKTKRESERLYSYSAIVCQKQEKLILHSSDFSFKFVTFTNQDMMEKLIPTGLTHHSLL